MSDLKLQSKKEGKYLVFEFENGKDVKFDLSTGNFIGKKGNPVKSLSGQLSGYKIQEVIDSFPDENYKKFLQFIYNNTCKFGGIYYCNVGTFLNYVKQYLNLEQFFACGLYNVDLDNRLNFKDVPKSIIKLCRDNNNFKITEILIERYKNNIHMWENLFSVTDFEYFKPYDVIQYHPNGSNRHYNNFLELINTYNYKPISLCRYVDNILRFEGEDWQDEVINILKDYTTMMNIISPKFEKYPRYLRTTHNIAVRNYNRLKKEHNEELFERRIKKELEYTYKNWIVIYPKSTQDIKDEAVQQNNCVASYIDNVIEGQCDIVFLRKKDNPNTSLVTVEVRNGKVVQQKGRFNRDTTLEEKKVLEKYEEYLHA